MAGGTEALLQSLLKELAAVRQQQESLLQSVENLATVQAATAHRLHERLLHLESPRRILSGPSLFPAAAAGRHAASGRGASLHKPTGSHTLQPDDSQSIGSQDDSPSRSVSDGSEVPAPVEPVHASVLHAAGHGSRGILAAADSDAGSGQSFTGGSVHRHTSSNGSRRRRAHRHGLRISSLPPQLGMQEAGAALQGQQQVPAGVARHLDLDQERQQRHRRHQSSAWAEGLSFGMDSAEAAALLDQGLTPEEAAVALGHLPSAVGGQLHVNIARTSLAVGNTTGVQHAVAPSLVGLDATAGSTAGNISRTSLAAAATRSRYMGNIPPRLKALYEHQAAQNLQDATTPNLAARSTPYHGLALQQPEELTAGGRPHVHGSHEPSVHNQGLEHHSEKPGSEQAGPLLGADGKGGGYALMNGGFSRNSDMTGLLSGQITPERQSGTGMMVRRSAEARGVSFAPAALGTPRGTGRTAEGMMAGVKGLMAKSFSNIHRPDVSDLARPSMARSVAGNLLRKAGGAEGDDMDGQDDLAIAMPYQGHSIYVKNAGPQDHEQMLGDEEDPDRPLTRWDKWYLICFGLINPEGRTKWDMFILLLLLWICFASPVIICFGLGTQIHTGNRDRAALIIELIVDAFFVIDILLNFRTAYYDSVGNLVSSRARIAKHYAKTWFLLDLISVVPFDLLTEGAFSFLSMLKLIRVVRVGKVLRMLRVYRLLRVRRLPRILEKIEFFLDKGILQLIMFALSVGLLAHLSACIFHYMALLTYLLEGSWAGTWIEAQGLEHADLAHRYLNSLYWAFTTVATVGYGDITPKNQKEKVLTIFVMCSGVTLVGYVTSSITNMMSIRNAMATATAQKKQLVTDVLKNRQVPSALARRVTSFFNYESTKLIRSQEEELLQDLPFKLRSRFLQHTYADSLSRFSPFTRLRPDVLIDVIAQIKTHLFVDGDIIALQGDFVDSTFFLHEGKAELRVYDFPSTADPWAILEATNKDELAGFEYTIQGRLKKTYYFGHASTLHEGIWPATVIARNCCELYTFDRAALQELAERHPIELGGLLVSPTPPHVGERPDASTAVSIELLQVTPDPLAIATDFPVLDPPPRSSGLSRLLTNAVRTTVGGMGQVAAAVGIPVPRIPSASAGKDRAQHESESQGLLSGGGMRHLPLSDDSAPPLDTSPSGRGGGAARGLFHMMASGGGSSGLDGGLGGKGGWGGSTGLTPRASMTAAVSGQPETLGVVRPSKGQRVSFTLAPGNTGALDASNNSSAGGAAAPGSGAIELRPVVGGVAGAGAQHLPRPASGMLAQPQQQQGPVYGTQLCLPAVSPSALQPVLAATAGAAAALSQQQQGSSGGPDGSSSQGDRRPSDGATEVAAPTLRHASTTASTTSTDGTLRQYTSRIITRGRSGGGGRGMTGGRGLLTPLTQEPTSVTVSNSQSQLQSISSLRRSDPSFADGLQPAQQAPAAVGTVGRSTARYVEDEAEEEEEEEETGAGAVNNRSRAIAPGGDGGQAPVITSAAPVMPGPSTSTTTTSGRPPIGPSIQSTYPQQQVQSQQQHPPGIMRAASGSVTLSIDEGSSVHSGTSTRLMAAAMAAAAASQGRLSLEERAALLGGVAVRSDQQAVQFQMQQTTGLAQEGGSGADVVSTRRGGPQGGLLGDESDSEGQGEDENAGVPLMPQHRR